jgi:hypothetical protein
VLTRWPLPEPSLAQPSPTAPLEGGSYGQARPGRAQTGGASEACDGRRLLALLNALARVMVS